MYMFIESLYCYYYVAIENGFRVPIQVLGIRGFGSGDRLSFESVFDAVSGFDFRFRVWVHKDFTRSESAPLPSLTGTDAEAAGAGDSGPVEGRRRGGGRRRTNEGQQGRWQTGEQHCAYWACVMTGEPERSRSHR